MFADAEPKTTYEMSYPATLKNNLIVTRSNFNESNGRKSNSVYYLMWSVTRKLITFVRCGADNEKISFIINIRSKTIRLRCKFKI